MKSPLYIVNEATKEIEVLTLTNDGFWIDTKGTFWAYRDDAESVDKRDICGVGLFTLPEAHEANDICRYHDTAYSTPFYMAYHTRQEADEMLYKMLRGKFWFAKTFYILTRLFGGKFWKGKKL